MEITEVKIRKIMTEGRLRAVVSVTVSDMLAIHDIKIVQGDERLFVAMPSRKDENGVFRDIVHPISAAGRKVFEGVEQPDSPYMGMDLHEIFDTLANFRVKYWNI